MSSAGAIATNNCTLSAASFSENDFTATVTGIFHRNPDLENLTVVTPGEFPEKSLSLLGHFKKLTTLELELPLLTKIGLNAIQGLPNLLSLFLRNIRQIHDLKTSYMTKLLVNLEVNTCGEISAPDFSHLLSGFPQLEFLKLIKLRISNDTLLTIPQCQNIRLLSINGCSGFDQNHLLRLIMSLRNLTAFLAIDCAELGDLALDQISRKNFTRLDLKNCRSITDRGVISLSRCTTLTTLNLRGSKITDRALGALRALPKLQTLDISECTLLTYEGIGHLLAIKALTQVTLTQSWGISDSALENLRRNKALTVMSTGKTEQRLIVEKHWKAQQNLQAKQEQANDAKNRAAQQRFQAEKQILAIEIDQAAYPVNR